MNTTTTHAPLVGNPIGENVLDSLNRRLTNSGIKMMSIATHVTGTNAENARLMVEGIITGREWTPIILEVPLRDSKAMETNDKNFVDILFGTPGTIVKEFFREIAMDTTFTEGSPSNNGVIHHEIPEQQSLFHTK